MLNRIRNEDGVTLIIVAASLIMMMGMAAIVIDGGFGFTERRQAQSGADFAALAALQYSVSCQQAGGCDLGAAAEAGFTEAERVVAANLPGRALDWPSCNDPTPLARPASTTNCVSFNSNFTQSRVVLPPDTFDTVFGRVIGRSDLTVGALAEAGQGMNMSAVVVPLRPAGSGPELCLYTPPTSQSIPPCDGPSGGNFGYLDLALFGDDTDPSTAICTSGNQNKKIAYNLAIGADHLLTTYDGEPSVNDHEACPNRAETPDEVVFEQGNPGPLTEGLFSGVAGNLFAGYNVDEPARLRCLAGPCADVRDTEIDNRPLWTYTTGTCGSVSTRDEMIDCLDNWDSDNGVIFTTDLAQNLRFVVVPDVSDSPSSGDPKDQVINKFVPVWLETIYMNCNAGDCRAIHSPGADLSATGPGLDPCPSPHDPAVVNCGWDQSQGNDEINQLTAFEIELGMLPVSIREILPGQPGLREFSLVK